MGGPRQGTVALCAKGIEDTCQGITLVILCTTVQAGPAFVFLLRQQSWKLTIYTGAHMVDHAKRFLRLSRRPHLSQLLLCRSRFD